MNPRLRDTLARLASFALAGVLLYLALRGVDFSRVGQDLLTANYWWLAPIVAVTLFSHWLRAWRWTLLLDEIESEEEAIPRVDTLGAFGALMIGYLANYVAPRAGEVVRTASISRRYRLPFVGVLGTVISERALDMVTLLTAFLTLPLVFAGRVGAIRDLLVEPLRGAMPSFSPLLATALILVVLGLAWSMARYLNTHHSGRLAGLWKSLKGGLYTVAITPHRASLLVSTVVIWLCYGLMAYLPLVMFGFQNTFEIGFVGAWGIMLLGAIGVVIPAPGGFGSYHYITIQSLVLLFAFTNEAAASYALLTHTGQLLIYVITGAACILGMGLSFARPQETPVT